MGNIEHAPHEPKESPLSLNTKFRKLIAQLPLDDESAFMGPVTDAERREGLGEIDWSRVQFSGKQLEDYSSEMQEHIKDSLRASEREHRMQEKRSRSGHKERMFSMLDTLLDGAPHITPSFRQYVVHEVNADYQAGTRDDEVMSNLGWLSDAEHPESGGFFDPAHAKDFERKAYGQWLDNFLLSRRFLDIAQDPHIDDVKKAIVETVRYSESDDVVEDEIAQRVFQRRRIHIATPGDLQIWRKEFAEKYDDEI